MKFTHSPVGTGGLNLRLEGNPGTDMTSRLLALDNYLRNHPDLMIKDTVIGYRSLVIFFCTASINRTTLLNLAKSYDPEPSTKIPSGNLIRLPVWYSPESGPDLIEAATLCRLSIEELIAAHTSPTYSAAATGFAPGFCYLGQTPNSLTLPRLRTPRRLVAPGSVAVADNQTAVYPTASPGGWRLLGRCPTPLVCMDWPTPVKIQVGDRVQFFSISREEYIDMGGTP